MENKAVTVELEGDKRTKLQYEFLRSEKRKKFRKM